MTEQEVKDLIEAFIVANGVNAITADVLRPILIAILTQPNDEIGDLSTLNTVTQANLVDAINEIYNAVNNIENDGIQLYQGDSDPNVEPPDSYDIADFYFEEGTQLWQYNGVEWVKVNSLDSINLPFKGRFDYIDSPIFSLPTGVKALDVRFNGTGSDINWNQLGDNVKYNGTIGPGDYLIVIGLYSNVPIGTIPSLEMVTSQGSQTLVTIQSPDAVNADDLATLGQVEEMVENFPAVDTNLFNSDLTLSENRIQDLGGRMLRFFNGIFRVPAVTFDETTSPNTVPNKIWYDGLKLWLTNNLGINKSVLLDGDIVDASETQKGLVNLLTQTFFGNKSIKGTSAGIINLFEVINSNNVKMFQVNGEGLITVGTIFNVGGISLNAATNSISFLGSKALSKEGANLYVGQASGWTSTVMFAGNNERARTTNGAVGSTPGFRVTGNLEVTDGIVLKDSVSGNKFKITVNSSGVLSTSPITF